ncbi:hypothetical protein Aglo03_47270 [Actinokineospora globicatena]|uniref:Uncharacterized protein n=1 Tax=Actinokineospora globicatena TaxID=103729 RepID=A0A9W6QPS0_9PSEU|nr:hypothetical protein Aglo03_47270 [Actinokineospora globicatena]
MEWRRRATMVSIALGAAYAGQQVLPDAGWLLGVVGGVAVNIATNTSRMPTRSPDLDVSYLHRLRVSA